MQKCGQIGCGYRTNVTTRLANHINQTGHGQTSERRRKVLDERHPKSRKTYR